MHCIITCSNIFTSGYLHGFACFCQNILTATCFGNDKHCSHQFWTDSDECHAMQDGFDIKTE